MLDKELRLAEWNCKVEQILDISEELMEERKGYGDYIR